MTRALGRSAALLPLGAMTLVITWWGWREGGFFDVVFLPGTVLLLVALAMMLALLPWPVSLRGPAAISLGALVGLGAWTLLSALWSDAPADAISDAQHIAVYAAAFALGVWLCALLRDRPLLALSPIVIGGGIVTVATVLALWLNNDPTELVEGDATLRFPIGYRNAEAAFFLILVWPMVAYAAARQLPAILRGVSLGLAAACMGLAVLAQSRGSVFALPLAAIVLIAFHPSRLQVAFWLALAAAPVVLALPWLLDVYQAGGGNTAVTLGPLEDAATAIAVTSAAAVGLGWAMARVDPVGRLSERATVVVGRVAAVAAAIGIVVGVFAVTKDEGGPIEFINRHASQLSAGSTDLSEQGARFGLDLRTERGDLWRVAIDDFQRDPLVGEGAGTFRYSYMLHRDSLLEALDTHSVELQMAAELGLPGILLFGAFIVGALMAALRSRAIGPEAAATSAAVLGLGTYWLVHSSVDWFWDYGALTLPAVFALGVAAAPALPAREAEPAPEPWRRGLLVGALCLVALTMVPFFLSARYTDHAIRTSQEDPAAAYDDLDRAADLNPWSSRPLAAKASIAQSAGQTALALSALDEAIDRTPRDWILYWQKAQVLAQTDPAGAAAALQEARRRNPLSPEIDELAGQIPIGH